MLAIIILSLSVLSCKKTPEHTATRNAMDKDDEADQKFEDLRKNMVLTQIETRGITDKKVLETMLSVPRHEYVDASQKDLAYIDRPLPIGMGQTISQPYIVALMTESLDLRGNEKVLEIGTGSGYQAAVLAEIVSEVYTVEIIPSLYEVSKQRLERYDNVWVSNHDGYFGWEEYAPFDKIMVTAAPDHIPQPLLAQLKDSGIMVIPVGPTGWDQTLYKVIKDGESIITMEITGVRFVPLTRE